MSFHTFEMAELPDDHDEDIQLEFTTADSMLGIQLSAEEALAVGDALQSAAEEDDFESWDAKPVDGVASATE